MQPFGLFFLVNALLALENSIDPAPNKEISEKSIQRNIRFSPRTITQTRKLKTNWAVGGDVINLDKLFPKSTTRGPQSAKTIPKPGKYTSTTTPMPTATTLDAPPTIKTIKFSEYKFPNDAPLGQLAPSRSVILEDIIPDEDYYVYHPNVSSYNHFDDYTDGFYAATALPGNETNAWTYREPIVAPKVEGPSQTQYIIPETPSLTFLHYFNLLHSVAMIFFGILVIASSFYTQTHHYRFFRFHKRFEIFMTKAMREYRASKELQEVEKTKMRYGNIPKRNDVRLMMDKYTI